MIKLSLHDLYLLFLRQRKFFRRTILIMGMIALALSLIKPLIYSIEGRFTTMENASSFSSIESLMKPKQTNLPLLYYYPVLERTIEVLHLHGQIMPLHRQENRKLKNKLKAELFYLQPWVCSPKRQSYTHYLIPPEQEALSLTSLVYNSHFSNKFTITFLDEVHYQVNHKQKGCLGEGKINHPFTWEEHSFTLAKEGTLPLTGQRFILKLLPKEILLGQLERKIKVKKDPLSLATYVVKYSHLNAEKAALLVNTFMDEYQRYLHHLSRDKIKAYNDYLSLRKEEARKLIHQVMVEESQQGKEEFASLEMEQKYINQQQSYYFEQLRLLSSQIELLDERIVGYKRAIEEINPPEKETKELSSHLLLQRISTQENGLDQIEIKSEQCASYLKQVEKEEQPLPNLASFLMLPSLQLIATKIEKIERALGDEENYSEKEKELFREQRLFERKLLKEELIKLQESYKHERHSFQTTLLHLQKTLQATLYEEYLYAKKRIFELDDLAKQLPEKWYHELARDSTITLESTMVKGLAQLIEAQNLQEQIAPYNVVVLQKATPPSLVNPPHLLLASCMGGGFGLLLALMLTLLRDPKEEVLPFSKVKERIKEFLLANVT